MTAKKPSISSKESVVVSAWPTNMIPPIIITPLMALAPDMRGVWRTEGTLDMTSIPKNMDKAITKMASLYVD